MADYQMTREALIEYAVSCNLDVKNKAHIAYRTM